MAAQTTPRASRRPRGIVDVAEKLMPPAYHIVSYLMIYYLMVPLAGVATALTDVRLKMERCGQRSVHEMLEHADESLAVAS